MVAYTVYQTSQKLFVVRHESSGGEGGAECWRVLKLDRCSPAVDAAEDPHAYSRPQIQRLLASIHAGNQAHGGLSLVCEAQALLGCVAFTEGFYLLLCTRRRYLGAICGHKVYGIDATALLPLLSPAAHHAQYGAAHAGSAEVRYRRLLAGVQLNKDFFFSYSWPIHQTVQRTYGQAPDEWWADAAGSSLWDSPRVWNEYLSRPLREALGGASSSAHRWAVPICHGFFEQRPLALLGRPLTLTLIARRSRQFAGTRYLKRGVSEGGAAANDVEIEQVVEAGLDWKTGSPLLASVVQLRGSIPLPWAQRPDSSMMKPEIVLHRWDPMFSATRAHFGALRAAYGEPVCVLDLVKREERRPRESLLGQEYAQAVRFLNARLAPGQQRVQYTAYDLSTKARAARKALLADLQRLQEPVLAGTGLFAAPGARPVPGTAAGGAVGSGSGGGGGGTASRLQQGVLRTNCIDSLDRTNVAQFTYAMLALGQQLQALGLAEGGRLDPGSSLARHLMDVWERLGHTLALQYGGSEAHTAFFQRARGDWEAATQGRDLLTAVRRAFSNVWADAEKQDALNVFLGSFRPAPGQPHVWELGSDAYLHHAGQGTGRMAGRAAGLGSRSNSFTAGGGSASLATAMSAGSEGIERLESLPPPVSPPRRPPPHGRLGSPPADGQETPPPLPESLSEVSLVSLSSDGSFAPPLSALVEGASPRSLHRALSSPIAEEGPEEVTTPRAASSTAAAAADGLGGGAGGAASAGAGPSQPARLLPQRSPLLSTARKPAKLESLDKILGRQPVAHVRLTAAPPPSRQPALAWLSPSKAGAAARAAVAGVSQPSVAAAKAAKAAVAAAGVGAAGPGVPIPGSGLRRSNSDPNLSCSLKPEAPIAAAAAAGRGLPPAPRRVTFDTAELPGGSGSGGGLHRQATAPTSALDRLGSSGLGAPASCGGLGPAFGSSLPGQLLLVAGPEQLLPGALPGLMGAGAASGSYHTLAGLNLEGAAAAEASIKPGSGPPLDTLPAAKPATRRLSFPNFARLRGALTRKASLDGGGSGGGLQAAAVAAAAAGGSGVGVSVGRSATEPALSASLSGAPTSLLGPRMSSLGSGALGLEPLSMSAVVYGAEAVRRGVDSLGQQGPASAFTWLTGADPASTLAAHMEEAARLRAQIVRQREALATPLDPVEQRALLEQCAAAMRPSWALSLAAFTRGPAPAPPPPPAEAAGTQRGPAAAPPVPPHGLAF